MKITVERKEEEGEEKNAFCSQTGGGVFEQSNAWSRSKSFHQVHNEILHAVRNDRIVNRAVSSLESSLDHE